MKFQVLYMHESPREVVDAVEELAREKPHLEVIVSEWPDPPRYVPSPVARYDGQCQVNEYGAEAVIHLIKDIREGRVS